MYKVFFLFFLLYNSSYFPESFEVIGKGEGPTIEIAKEEALTDLTQKIMVNVKSEFTSNEIQKVENDQWIKQNKEEFDTYKNKIISLKSELPLLSPKFQSEIFYKNKNLYYIEVILNSEDKKVYSDRLNSLYNNINLNYSLSKIDENSNNKTNTLKDILKDINVKQMILIIIVRKDNNPEF